MQNRVLRFSWFTHAYVWMFLVALSTTPVIAVLLLRRGFPIDTADWEATIAAMFCIQVLFWYSQKRCSSEVLSYWNGLLFVAAFMSTGWVYFSMAFIFPALLLVFLASIGLSVYYDLFPSKMNAAFRFHQMIHFFQKNRMRQ